VKLLEFGDKLDGLLKVRTRELQAWFVSTLLSLAGWLAVGCVGMDAVRAVCSHVTPM
jgi:hypothetical protein